MDDRNSGIGYGGLYYGGQADAVYDESPAFCRDCFFMACTIFAMSWFDYCTYRFKDGEEIKKIGLKPEFIPGVLLLGMYFVNQTTGYVFYINDKIYQFEDETVASSCEKAGFSKEAGESELIRFTLGEAESLAFLSKMKKIPYYIASIGEISDEQYRAAIKNYLFIGQKGLLEDLGYLKRDWFDAELSTCIITDNEVNGLFLVRVLPSGVLMPVFMYAQGADYTKNIISMLALSIKRAEKKYPPETGVQVCRSKKATWDLMKKLFPKQQGNNAFFGSRAE